MKQTKITDNNLYQWGYWGPSGAPVSRVNEAVEPWCLVANAFTYEFGPANDLAGSMIYGLRVFAIEDSQPAGFIDSISRFEIVGWAFDPIAPLRTLSVEVFIDGVLVMRGNTGVSRPDIVSAYQLPRTANPGFAIKLPSFPRDPTRVLTFHVEWPGIFRRQRSENVTFWTNQPPGQILEVAPSFVRGWAYLVDFPAEYVALEHPSKQFYK